MDKMEFFEIRAILKHEYYSHKDSWEQTRLIAWTIAQVNSKNKLKMSDIIDFAWEKEDMSKEELKKSVSQEEITRLREQAREFAKLL